MSKFVIRSKTPRDKLDWGTMAWFSNPPPLKVVTLR